MCGSGLGLIPLEPSLAPSSNLPTYPRRVGQQCVDRLTHLSVAHHHIPLQTYRDTHYLGPSTPAPPNSHLSIQQYRHLCLCVPRPEALRHRAAGYYIAHYSPDGTSLRADPASALKKFSPRTDLEVQATISQLPWHSRPWGTRLAEEEQGRGFLH